MVEYGLTAEVSARGAEQAVNRALVQLAEAGVPLRAAWLMAMLASSAAQYGRCAGYCAGAPVGILVTEALLWAIDGGDEGDGGPGKSKLRPAPALGVELRLFTGPAGPAGRARVRNGDVAANGLVEDGGMGGGQTSSHASRPK